MRSMTIEGGYGIPSVYCQRTEPNEILCSLMSAVLQRDVCSKRFDRNQRRETTERCFTADGSSVTMTVPQGPFRSNIIIVQLVLEHHDAEFLDSLVAIGTNRGHSVASMVVQPDLKLSQIRAALISIQKQNVGSELFLCLPNGGGYFSNLIKSCKQQPELAVCGWMFVEHQHYNSLIAIAEATAPLQYLSAPCLIVTKDPDLIHAATTNPFALVIQLPESQTTTTSTMQWISRCLVEFCDAESARRRHSRELLPMYSKL